MTILLRQKSIPQVVRQIVQRDNGAWFDPEDMSTMFQDAAGTTPVTALEQPVGRWLDKSGNGNHATQSITASRPTLSARYNLLTKTEDFADAAWQKLNNGTGTAPTLTLGQQDPVWGNNATRLQCYINGSSLNDYSQLQYTINSIPTNSTVRGKLWVRSRTGINQTLYYRAGTISPSSTAIATSVWTELDVQSISDAASVFFTVGLRGSATGPSTLDIDIWHPQLTLTSAALSYQRVNTATDYDSVGWPRYLKGDGIDDFFNLPFMNLYGNGACSIISARDAVSQATDTYIISECSTTDVDPKYFPSRQLASGGNMDSYIVSDEGTVRLDTTGSAFSGAKLAVIRSVVDSGSNIKLFKNGAVAADDNYTRVGILTPTNTTIGASVSTTTSNYASMRLYSLIITKSALSDTDRRRCEQFLASRLSTLGVTLS